MWCLLMKTPPYVALPSSSPKRGLCALSIENCLPYKPNVSCNRLTQQAQDTLHHHITCACDSCTVEASNAASLTRKSSDQRRDLNVHDQCQLVQSSDGQLYHDK